MPGRMGGFISALRRSASDFAKFVEKTVLVAADVSLMEDSAASGAKSRFQVGNLPFSNLTGSAPANVTKATASAGVSTTVARSDHKHDITTAAAATMAVGGSSAEGTATSLARSDHTHQLASFGSTGGTFCQGNDARLSDDRVASGLRSATTVVSVSAATAPVNTQVLTATGTAAANWQTPTVGAGPAGSAGQIQFNDGGGPAAMAADARYVWDTVNVERYINGNIYFSSMAVPATPAAGSLRISCYDWAGRGRVTVTTPSGFDRPIQPSLGERDTIGTFPSNTTGISGWGLSYFAFGTLSTPTITTTNIQTSMRQTLATTANPNGSAGGIQGSADYIWRGNAAGLGGFSMVCRFAMSAVSNQAFFVGLCPTGGGAAPTTAVSSLINMCGFGRDTGDANMQFMRNGGTGTATKTDLGASFPRSATDMYQARMWAPPNGSVIYYWIKNIATGAIASGSVNSNLPTVTVFMTFNCYTVTGGGVSTIAWAVNYLESGN